MQLFQISISSFTDGLQLWNSKAGTPLGEEFIGHFLSGAGNVITTWLCAFDKLQ